MNIVITGTSSGIGKELVLQFLNSTLVSKIYACTSSKTKLNFDDNRVEVAYLNFLEGDSIVKFSEKIAEKGIDIVINNAGYLQSFLFQDGHFDELRKMHEVNYFGPYQLIHVLLPHLKEVKGQVINIGSMGGFQGSLKFPGLAAYSSSKSALACLSECLAEELKHDSINVNCLALGAVDTEMLKKAFPDYQADTTAKEIAAFVKGFSESTGKLINGKVIPVSKTTP